MGTAGASALIAAGSLVAGFLGALTGLGGGVVVIPMLVLLFGVDIRHAAGASLVSVIATSSGAAAAYVKEGFSNIRIGMFLEIATTLGALGGAYLSGVVSTKAIGLIFAAVLLQSAVQSFHPPAPKPHGEARDPLATRLRLHGSYPDPQGQPIRYSVERVPLGFGLMAIAGALSGLLGVGSGGLKVIAMDRAMRIPFKVSTTTSNFMIGVTAAASAGVYLRRGYIDPAVAAPVMLGVLAGAQLGARLLPRAPVKTLRFVFGTAILALGVEMIYSSLTGKL